MNEMILQADYLHDIKPLTKHFSLHFHNCYEIFCFLSGKAQYSVEGNFYPLKAGDILLIRKSEAHTLLIQGNIPYERIVINFNEAALLYPLTHEMRMFLDEQPLGIYNRFPYSLFKEKRWLQFIKKVCHAQSEQEKRLYLSVLVQEMFENYGEIQGRKTDKSSIADVIQYINRHLTEDISLDRICQRFFISKTHLNRKFRQITGSSVWGYVLAKRLTLAQELLSEGMRPTEVAAKCGFAEYSAFYRAYKQRFLSSPKQHHQKI